VAGETTSGDTAGQAPAGSQPREGAKAAGQEPAAGSGQAPAADTQPGTETAEQKADRLERELAEARREAAGHRTKATALEKQQREAADAQLSEQERLAKRTQELEATNAQLQAQLRTQAVRSATVAAAQKLNYRNPDLAYRLIDAASLEFDDEGQPKGVERTLRELAQREPYLVKGAAGADYGGGARGETPNAQPTMNELLRSALGKG
jgi:hypothetical protein